VHSDHLEIVIEAVRLVARILSVLVWEVPVPVQMLVWPRQASLSAQRAMWALVL
jgi:hypothetical protein